MAMEEKIVINELEHGRELAKRLMSNLKHPSSTESSKTLISDILRIYENTILILSFKEDDKNILKRRHETEDKDSKNVFKKRRMSEKKTEKVRVFVGTGQENGLMDDGYCWRKYGQKQIHGSINPRGYFRCTHRFTHKCLAMKQVQKSDKHPSIFEVKYLGTHTCNNSTFPTATSFSVSMFEEGNRVDITEQQEDTKLKKTEEAMMISLEDPENKKNIFQEIENVCGWKSNVFQENLSPGATTSGSGITGEIATASACVEDSETADSFFSYLDDIIDLG